MQTALLIAALATTAAAQQVPGVRPLATVRQLHDLLMTPASDAVFQGGAEAPSSPAAWDALGHQALILGESGNLLMLAGRAPDNDGWMRLSRALVDAAAGAAAAAERRDPDALGQAGDRITSACEACHQPYRDGGRQMGTGR